MFQRFLGDRNGRKFKARSADRDAETDLARLTSIFDSIDDVIRSAEAELSGLTRRVDDALARASVTGGNDSDEYLTRDAVDEHYLDRLDSEISRGQRRLQELSTNIAHFKFLKATAVSRFPGFRPSSQSDVAPPPPKFGLAGLSK
jgi:hypothetical protein